MWPYAREATSGWPHKHGTTVSLTFLLSTWLRVVNTITIYSIIYDVLTSVIESIAGLRTSGRSGRDVLE